ncbi:hypothetical protein UA08_08149 [Talaromyces atroroseus]|uniref:Uncharacterized protein n=1 Tax=Talaromyces atroroseus TaxID=1441469 RepID=A0A225AHQ5_TALAT|nr:hypothetical protein UA08_08149 [Talaromyces atroroseus]OKL56608.1 hypothetical protein UA08_08149 [Talaromyces atroroseus]
MDIQLENRSGRKRNRTASADPSSSSPDTNDATTERSETLDDDNDGQGQQQQQQPPPPQETGPSQLPSPDQTPKRAKRVRFSEPVLAIPSRSGSLSGATGLTPTFMRTSIDAGQSQENEEEEEEEESQTPSRRNRRRSAPSTVPGTTLIDPVRTNPTHVQYYPMRQILDGRVARRLWRSGLSEEQNAIEREKKDEKKSLQKARAQIEALERKVEFYESAQANTNDISDNFDTILVGDDSTVDDSVFVSESPVLNNRHREEEQRGTEPPGLDHVEASPPTTSPKTPTADSSVQVDIQEEDCFASEEHQLMSAELSAARKEKQDLFNEWRKLKTGQSELEPNVTPNESPDSPPPDFMKQIVPAMASAIQRASSADQALEMVRGQLSNMGFSGANVDELLSQLRESIRSARLELESVLPGETPAGLIDGKSTFEALVKILKQSSGALLTERKHTKWLSDCNKALKNQFDKTLETLESERLRGKRYEEYTDASAEDMLHVRMRIQELEAELAEQAITIERQNQALKHYYEEGKNFEAIIEKLEDEKRADGEISASRVAELQAQLAKKSDIALEQAQGNSVLGNYVESEEYSTNDLVDMVKRLEANNARLLDELAKQEREIENLNARFSQESASLQSAVMELKRKNELLVSQRKEEAEFRDGMEQFFANWMEQGKKFLRTQHWSARARREKLGNGSNSADLRPLANSPTKAIRDGWSNVRLGRGKDCRTLITGDPERGARGRDSGIDLLDDSSLDPGAVTRTREKGDEGGDPMDELLDVDQGEENIQQAE